MHAICITHNHTIATISTKANQKYIDNWGGGVVCAAYHKMWLAWENQSYLHVKIEYFEIVKCNYTSYFSSVLQ